MEKSIYSKEYSVVLRLLRQAREEAGMTQEQVAKKIEETQSYVSKVERGELRLDILQLRTICQALGMSLLDFVRKLERQFGGK